MNDEFAYQVPASTIAQPDELALDSCEICNEPVASADAHYVNTAKDRTRRFQNGYWSCHLSLDKWRCAKCGHCWKPPRSPKTSLPICPHCKEDHDVFPADDGVWEQVAKERSQRGYEDNDYDM